MKVKILTAVILSAVFCMYGVCFAANSLSIKNETEILNTVKLLEIANGDQNGNMMLDNDVTRAQFVKMAVSASSSKQTAQDTKLNVSLFPDVNKEFWGAGYISVAIKNGLITGYLDGTFKPDNNVKLEEAVTIILKLLGYTENEVMGSYPNSQIAKYRSLELDTGIETQVGQQMKRRDCIRLIYNALCVKAKSGSIYCTTLGYKAAEDGTIDYNSLVESKLNGPFIITDDPYEYIERIFGTGYNSYTYYRDGDISKYSDIKKYDVLYYIDEIKTAWSYSDKLFGVVQAVVPDAVNPVSAVISDTSVNIAAGATGISELKKDSYVMTLYDRTGKACAFLKADADMYNSFHDPDGDYLDSLTSTVTSAFVVKDSRTWIKESRYSINGETKYLLGSKEIDSDLIQNNDVLYFSEPFNTVLVYRKTATGVVKNVSLQNNIPTSVNLTNKSYSLATNEIKSKFASHGIYNKENAFITLLLGMNDDAVDVIAGDMSKLSDNKDNASYIEMIEHTLEGPFVLSSLSELDSLPIDIKKSKIVCAGNEIAYESLRENDVYYYSELAQSVLVYRDTVSGMIEDISTPAAPASVTVAGKPYTIENQAAAYDFSSFGKYKIGDTVTLLLGKTGIAGALGLDEDTTSTLYGVVVEKGEKQYKRADGTTYTGEYITVTDTGGNNHSFECDNKYYGIGYIVRVIIGSSVSVSKVSTDIGIGNASRVASAIENGKFADNCEIIDVYNGNVKKIFPDRISGIRYDINELVYSGGVKFYKFNDENELEILILGNLTGDLHEYGVITSNSDGVVKYITDGAEKRYSTDNAIEKGPAIFRTSIDGVSSVKPMLAYIDVEMITNHTVIDKEQNEYRLADRVNVYFEKDDAYKVISLNEVKSGDYTIRAYYDRNLSTGGRIRVIVAS